MRQSTLNQDPDGRDNKDARTRLAVAEGCDDNHDLTPNPSLSEHSV